MSIQNHSTTIRFDTITYSMLKDLINDLNFNKSQVIRHSIRLLKELLEIKSQRGEILVRMENSEKAVVLII